MFSVAIWIKIKAEHVNLGIYAGQFSRTFTPVNQTWMFTRSTEVNNIRSCWSVASLGPNWEAVCIVCMNRAWYAKWLVAHGIVLSGSGRSFYLARLYVVDALYTWIHLSKWLSANEQSLTYEATLEYIQTPGDVVLLCPCRWVNIYWLLLGSVQTGSRNFIVRSRNPQGREKVGSAAGVPYGYA